MGSPKDCLFYLTIYVRVSKLLGKDNEVKLRRLRILKHIKQDH